MSNTYFVSTLRPHLFCVTTPDYENENETLRDATSGGSIERRTHSHGLCPQVVDDLSRDPMVMFENVDHVSITSTCQNAFKEGNDIIVFPLPGFQYSFLFAETSGTIELHSAT